MTQLLVGYLAVAGTLSAGLQVARGVVRGTGCLLAGDPRGALAQVAGGLLAPARQVYAEAGRLALDVFVAAPALSGDGSDPCSAGRQAGEPARSGRWS